MNRPIGCSVKNKIEGPIYRSFNKYVGKKTKYFIVAWCENHVTETVGGMVYRNILNSPDIYCFETNIKSILKELGK
jgi:hypothetical protein